MLYKDYSERNGSVVIHRHGSILPYKDITPLGKQHLLLRHYFTHVIDRQKGYSSAWDKSSALMYMHAFHNDNSNKKKKHKKQGVTFYIVAVVDNIASPRMFFLIWKIWKKWSVLCVHNGVFLNLWNGALPRVMLYDDDYDDTMPQPVLNCRGRKVCIGAVLKNHYYYNYCIASERSHVKFTAICSDIYQCKQTTPQR